MNANPNEPTGYSNSSSSFFKAGGTLNVDSPSYVIRPADDELFEAIRDGEFCYILTTRQMGKSSLMVRTATRLQAVDTKTAIIDLTVIGSHTSAEQWYLGLLTIIHDQLKLKANVEEWWRKNSAKSPSQRFADYLKEVVLTENKGQVAIFIDEIDSTLALAFSDDFFAVIRSIYNARPIESVYERVVFILLGVATPTDLMKDRRRTPFNVGKHIELHEFRQVDIDNEPTLKRWLQKLEENYPGEGQFIFNRVFYWTNGHPYLTQKVCSAIADQVPDRKSSWSNNDIDGIVDQDILSDRSYSDKNILFVSDKVLTHPNRNGLLKLYKRIFEGEKVHDEKTSHLNNQLKITGLVITDAQGNLQVSNRIYRTIFGEEWINRYLKHEWNRYLVPATAVTAVIIFLILTIFIVNSLQPSDPTPQPIVQGSETPLPISSTATPELQPSATANPTDILSPTTTDSPVDTETPPTPTRTDTPPTNTPISATDTPLPLPLNRARVREEAEVYQVPSTGFAPLTTIGIDEFVEILGQATTDGWFYIAAEDGTVGFTLQTHYETNPDLVINDLQKEDTPRVALVKNNVNLLPQASSENVITFVRAGELVTIIGRADNSNWLLIGDANNVIGFAVIQGGDGTLYLEWPATDDEIRALPTFSEVP